MSEAEIRAYVIADNRLAENAGWDRALLGLELQYLAELEIDFDVTVTGFDLPEIDILIGDLSLGLNDSDSADAAVGFGQSGEQLVRKSRRSRPASTMLGLGGHGPG